MKRIFTVAVVIAAIAVVLCASFLALNHLFISDSAEGENGEPTQPLPEQNVYLGVTYGGGDAVGARLLIDKVKSYTNLFIIQSSDLEKDITALNSVCRYAINSGLHIIVYFSAVPTYRHYISEFFATADLWGSNLLGIYFDDEPGGKMLDAQQVNLFDNLTGNIIQKNVDNLLVSYPNCSWVTFGANGLIEVNNNETRVTYQPDGIIYLIINSMTPTQTQYVVEPNGTIYQRDNLGNRIRVTNDSLIPRIPTYQEMQAQKPYQNYSQTEQIFVGTIQNSTSWPHSQTGAKLFTSDYALQWFDYKGGLDVVFTEFGWNHSTAQAIAQVRGAANIMDKDWGAIVTWKYTYPESVQFPGRNYGPYLPSGDEVYSELRQAYKAGAKYLVVFNYPTYPAGNPYGTLQEEHFSALQRLWTNVICNSTEVNGGPNADVALVLPADYGWGMRNPQDNIWGLWDADNRSGQIWNNLQKALKTYGFRLDIVYEDSAFPVVGKYTRLIYWYQTNLV